MLLLLIGELRNLVRFLFVDLQEKLRGDFLAFYLYLFSVGLEFFEFVIEIRADPSARPSEERVDIGLGAPLEPGDSWLDDLVGRLQVLCEQIPLILVHKVDDLVVLPHHDHCELPQHSQVLPVAHHELVGLVGDPDVERDQHLPGRDLVDELEQLPVEVALDVMRLRLQDLQGQLVVLVVFVRPAQNGH